jgi:hypothetical protein
MRGRLLQIITRMSVGGPATRGGGVIASSAIHEGGRTAALFSYRRTALPARSLRCG